MDKGNNNFVSSQGPDHKNKKTGEKKPWSTKRKIITFSLLGVLAVILVAGGIFAYKVFLDPRSAFQTAGDMAQASQQPSESPSPSQAPSETASASESPSPSPSPSVDPYEELSQIADTKSMKDIVTIGIFGIDYAPERTGGSYVRSNKHFYTDVDIVLAINFKKNTVDMISIPRDSWTKIPNKDGIYRMKEAFYFGGEMKNPDKGLKNSIKAMSWHLGGIPVNYYLAVTMPVVKELVNVIGGVDFDVDFNIRINGRTLKKGLQHLDGQQALDYFRARKSENINSGTGDINRVKRQKALLVAIFKKLKGNQMLSKMPDIIKSMQGKLFTNLSLEQLAALAVFGSKLDEDNNIKLYSFEGNLSSMFNWSFCFNDQNDRVDIIKQVYGVTVPKHTKYSYSYAKQLWASMQAKVYAARVKSVMKKDAAKAIPKITPEDTLAINTLVSDMSSKIKGDSGALNSAIDALKAKVTSVFATAGYSINWHVSENP